jgi:hypothetical protein
MKSRFPFVATNKREVWGWECPHLRCKPKQRPADVNRRVDSRRHTSVLGP